MGLTVRSGNYPRLGRWQTVSTMSWDLAKTHSGKVATAGLQLPQNVARRLLVTDKIPNESPNGSRELKNVS
jgi:hypothetical protein